MYLLQNWFNLSDEGVEDAIYDSYAMKQFMGVNFGANEQAPDATTLCKFRKLLNENHITEQLFKDVQDVLSEEGKMVQGGTIVDATIIAAPDTKKNKTTQSDPEMHTVKKGNKWYFGMRAHIGVDPLYGFVHTVVCTPANESEVKVAPNLLRPDDKVVYGDAGYLKMERYVEDDIERDYRINRQVGTFKLHYGDSLS
jgi:IS5 family transposase